MERKTTHNKSKRYGMKDDKMTKYRPVIKTQKKRNGRKTNKWKIGKNVKCKGKILTEK